MSNKNFEIYPLIRESSLIHGGSLEINFPQTASSLRLPRAPRAFVYLAHAPLSSFENNRTDYLAKNLEFTLRIAEKAASQGCEKFLFASTAAVYGTSRDMSLSESTSVNPESDYAEAKLAIEERLSNEFVGGPMTITSLRIFNVFGPGMINSLVNKLSEETISESVTLFGPDNFIRDYIHVRDVADITEELIASPHQLPSVLNLGSGLAISNRRLISLLPKARQQYISTADHAFSSSVADVTNLSRFSSHVSRLSFPVSSFLEF